MSTICAVCSRALRAGKALLTCGVCKRDCHISCTTSRHLGAKAVCLDCSASPANIKAKKEKMLPAKTGKESSPISGKKSAVKQRHDAHGEPPLTITNDSMRSSTPRGSPKTAAKNSTLSASSHSSHGSSRDESKINVATIEESMAIAPRATVPISATARQVSGTQASSSTSQERKADCSVLNSSNNDAMFNAVHSLSSSNKAIVSTLVEYSTTLHEVIDERFSELTSSVDGKFDSILKSLAILPAVNQLISGFSVKLSALEEHVLAHNSKLEELLSKNECLVNVNNTLKSKIKELEARVSTMVDSSSLSPTDLTGESGSRCSSAQHPLSSSGPSHLVGAGGTWPASQTDNSEVIVSGVLTKDAPSEIFGGVAYAVLGTLMPKLEQKDIVGVSALRLRSGTGQSQDPTENDESSRSERFVSLKVKVASRDVLEKVISGRRKFNYFSKKDLDSSLLAPEALSYIPDKRIFINEALPADIYKNLISTRKIAKSLGIRFLWHSRGKILARMKEGDRAHVIRSASDLDTIAKVGQNERGKSTRKSRSADGPSEKGPE